VNQHEAAADDAVLFELLFVEGLEVTFDLLKVGRRLGRCNSHKQESPAQQCDAFHSASPQKTIFDGVVRDILTLAVLTGNGSEQ
jgi:hypothetical protein